MKYQGLKKELEEIVDNLREGDGVVIEHKPNYIADRTIGYVYTKTNKRLNLARKRNPPFILEKLCNCWGAARSPCYYDSIENIRVVDPASGEPLEISEGVLA